MKISFRLFSSSASITNLLCEGSRFFTQCYKHKNVVTIFFTTCNRKRQRNKEHFRYITISSKIRKGNIRRICRIRLVTEALRLELECFCKIGRNISRMNIKDTPSTKVCPRILLINHLEHNSLNSNS